MKTIILVIMGIVFIWLFIRLRKVGKFVDHVSNKEIQYNYWLIEQGKPHEFNGLQTLKWMNDNWDKMIFSFKPLKIEVWRPDLNSKLKQMDIKKKEVKL